MSRQTLTTKEAAFLLGKDPRSFARWARKIGVEPLRHQRIGRSTIAVWSITALTEATRKAAA
jgi:hypothetical protein